MRKIALALLILSVLSSCRILRPSLMLKTPKGFAYDKVADSMAVDEYRISPTDAISFKLLSNEGFKMVDISSTNNNNAVGSSTFEAVVETDGTVKLPLIGRMKVQGYTIREAEQILETRFGEFYVGPYVVMRVSNRRVIVFPGNSGLARVVNIQNNNTTVFEALAMVGGLAVDGKAYKVKLIRSPSANVKPKVYLMDLSTIDGLKDGNTVVQANDIIYVESRDRVPQKLVTEVIPYISLLTSMILVYTLFTR